MLKLIPYAITLLLATPFLSKSQNALKIYRDTETGYYGYADNQGEIIIKPEYHNAMAFCSNLGVVRKGPKWAVINRQGELLTDFNYNEAYCMIDFDLVAVGNYPEGEPKTQWGYPVLVWGFVDDAGREVLPVKYDFDFAWTVNEESDGMMTQDEEYIAYNPGTGIFPIKLNEKYGMVKADGTIVMNFEYDEIREFINGFGLVKKDNLWAVINESGDLITEFNIGDLSRREYEHKNTLIW